MHNRMYRMSFHDKHSAVSIQVSHNRNSIINGKLYSNMVFHIYKIGKELFRQTYKEKINEN